MIFRSGLLDGKTAFVTGGGTGIGFGIAQALAECGAAVVLASRKSEHLEPAAARLREAGWQALAVQANVRDPDAVRHAVEQAANAFGGIDILVNNAAGNFYAPSAALSPNGWRAVLETDLSGTFHCCQAVYPFMQRQGGGRIVSVSMTLHYRGWPMMAHATAAKAGVDALTRTLALEWAGDGITVNAIAPGPIPTEGVRRAFSAVDEGGPTLDDRMKAQIPLGRWGTPEDVGQMAVYLSSPAGAWITGAIFVVDGGSWLART